MKTDRLRLALRLARRALNEAAMDVAAAAAQRRAVREALQAARDRRARERAEGPGALHLLASFVERSRRLERDLMARCAAVEAEEAPRIAAVRERRIELRRLELLEERAVQEERVAAARRQRRELDEFVTIKRAVR